MAKLDLYEALARQLRAEVARVFPLSRARGAYEFGLTSHPRGEVVLQVEGETRRADRTRA